MSIYGLFADPATIANQLNSLTAALPEEASKVITDQVTALSTRRQTLWSKPRTLRFDRAVERLGRNQQPADRDQRGLRRGRETRLREEAGDVTWADPWRHCLHGDHPRSRCCAAAAAESAVFGTGALRWVLQIIGWLIMVVLVAAALALLYRLGPDRDAPRMTWVSVGAVVATVMWLVASIGFSIYASTFGNYAKTYGVFAGIVVLLFWLWITMYAILLGAEINAESEQQTIADTTKGPEEPLGERGAVKADSIPPPKVITYDRTESIKNCRFRLHLRLAFVVKDDRAPGHRNRLLPHLPRGVAGPRRARQDHRAGERTSASDGTTPQRGAARPAHRGRELPGWISSGTGLPSVSGLRALVQEPGQPGRLLQPGARPSLPGQEEAQVFPWRLVRLLTGCLKLARGQSPNPGLDGH